MLFRSLLQGGIDSSCSEARMLADLRREIPEQADFFQPKAGLRRYKAEQILRIGSRDLCGLAELEEVTAELSGLAAVSLQRALFPLLPLRPWPCFPRPHRLCCRCGLKRDKENSWH